MTGFAKRVLSSVNTAFFGEQCIWHPWLNIKSGREPAWRNMFGLVENVVRPIHIH